MTAASITVTGRATAVVLDVLPRLLCGWHGWTTRSFKPITAANIKRIVRGSAFLADQVKRRSIATADIMLLFCGWLFGLRVGSAPVQISGRYGVLWIVRVNIGPSAIWQKNLVTLHPAMSAIFNLPHIPNRDRQRGWLFGEREG